MKGWTSKTRLQCCQICGAEYQAKSPNAKYCSEECRQYAYTGYTRTKQKKDKKDKKQTLSDYASEVERYNREHGTKLSYGMYEALKHEGRIA